MNVHPLNSAQIFAGDLYGEHDISLNDLVGITAVLSGTGSINQNP